MPAKAQLFAPRAASALLALAALVAVGSAAGAWYQSRPGAGSAQATSVAAGNVPTASKLPPRDVRVSWTASSFANGSGIKDYLVRRYDAQTGAQTTVNANCSGVVSALTCTETNVTRGSWQYTITPAAGKWRGAESAKSSTVAV